MTRDRLVLGVLPHHERDQLRALNGAVGRRLMSEHEAVLVSFARLAALDGGPQLELSEPVDRMDGG